MIIVIRFKYVALGLAGLALLVVLLFGRLVTVDQTSDGTIRATLISFLPLQTGQLSRHLVLASHDPRQQFELRCSTGYFRVRIRVREKNYPKGYPLTVGVQNLPTWLPGISRSFRKTVAARLKPELLQPPAGYNGTRTPVELKFTIPLKEAGIGRRIATDFPARMAPRTYRYRGKVFTDYATWWVIPSRPLKHNTQYRIVLDPALSGMYGGKLGEVKVFRFMTVPPLKVQTHTPAADGTEVSLLAPIEATANREVQKGKVKVPGISGKVLLQGKKILFWPDRVWMPDTQYRTVVELQDRFGEKAGTQWGYRTQKLEGPVWAEIHWSVPRTITVYHDQKPLKTLRVQRCSPGLKVYPTPVRIQKRGYAFYCGKLRAEGFYWIQTDDGLLIHSELLGLGGECRRESLPGCNSICLSVEDTRWLYQNLPMNAPLMVHGSGTAGQASERENQLDDLTFFQYKSDYDQFHKEHPDLQTGR